MQNSEDGPRLFMDEMPGTEVSGAFSRADHGSDMRHASIHDRPWMAWPVGTMMSRIVFPFRVRACIGMHKGCKRQVSVRKEDNDYMTDCNGSMRLCMFSLTTSLY